MKLKQLLKEQNIRTALIVDDACEPVPTAADMRGSDDEWATFNDDMDERHRALLAEMYPASSERGFDELMRDDKYVEAVWTMRDQLDGLADPLFTLYDSNQEADELYVGLVREKLEGLGLTVTARGRSFAAELADSDVVVIDLYFGSSQDDKALADSKKLLTEAIEPRVGNPPLVILMSRSEKLEAKRDDFRDEVGLLESGFRIIKKSDLVDGDRLELQLERLAQNATDTQRLARFFAALNDGIDAAATRTLGMMRRLKLSDIGQIQDLLLAVEGEPTGSYLVDVFDRVLQHEIESQEDIIDAALGLNKFSTALHPPPYVAGSAELQELVERTLTQHERRLGLPGAVDGLVAFGDLLRPVPLPAKGKGSRGSKLPGELSTQDVLLVLTPACDLQREGAPRILLLVGKIGSLTANEWKYGSDARTPAVRIGGDLCSVKWNLKHVDTVSWTELEKALEAGSVEVVARLREAHALEIQQQVLAGLGRVGLVAAMPATFAMEVEAYQASVPDGVPVRISVPELDDRAVCFVGRDKHSKPELRLVLTESGCDGLQAAIDRIEAKDVAEPARTALAHIQESGDLRRMLAAGLDLNGVGPAWSLIDSMTGEAKGVHKMGLVARSNVIPAAALQPKQLNKAGVMLLVKDAEEEGAATLSDAIPARIDTSLPEDEDLGGSLKS